MTEIPDAGSDDSFRQQLEYWIARHAPAGLSQVTDWSGLVLGANNWWAFEEYKSDPRWAEWERALLGERLICARFPAAYGGRGLSASRSEIVDRAFLAANVPRISREQGEAWVGPTIMAHGTEAQRERLLPEIVSGRARYSQCFSEPDHGSDLAGLSVRGRVVDGELRISGQKAWSSGAHHATHLMVLCRTGAAAARHKGLTFVLLPVRGNESRLEIRPVAQMNGKAEFCDVFLDDARAPLDNVIGAVDQGWRVAMTTLTAERGRARTRYAVYRRELDEFLATVAAVGLGSRARTALVDVAVQMTVMESSVADIPGYGASDDSAWEPVIGKLAASLFRRQFGDAVMLARGAAGLNRPPGVGYPVDRWQKVYLDAFAETIVAGTTEVQRNIIGERLLGLPRT